MAGLWVRLSLVAAAARLLMSAYDILTHSSSLTVKVDLSGFTVIG